jgi:competence ComEA-like helix-hairpin-helix protein
MKNGKRSSQWLRPRWKDHFSFSLRERRGLFALLVILSLEISVLYYLRYVHDPVPPAAWNSMLLKTDSLFRATEEVVDSMQPFNGNSRFAGRLQDSLFPFNPNTISVDQWVKLGLSPRQAQTVIHYRQRGGCFRVKTDLRRMKVIREDLVMRWWPFIMLPDSFQPKKNTSPIQKKWLVDAGQATAQELEVVRGIGPSLAARIVKYRSRLGGFYDKEQVREVYGISDTTWELVAPQLLVAVVSIHKLNVNEVPFDSLKAHPYVGYRLARQIDAYRLQHRFNSMEELRALPLVTPEIYRKFENYLEVR